MPKKGEFLDITGRQFGRWTAIECVRPSYRDSDGRKFNTLWRCQCSCGTLADVSINNLTNGTSASCGCLWLEHLTKHGLYDDPLYNTWVGIWHRCFDPSHEHYDRYGGRGISMSPEWVSNVSQFISDVRQELGDRPSASHTIDRINNDGDYEIGNIKWSTWVEQANNKSTTVWLTYAGVTLPMQMMCEKLDLGSRIVGQRIRKGWETERALSTPTRYPFSREKKDKIIMKTPEGIDP